VDQDPPFRQNPPLAPGRPAFGLLLAAHGERRTDATNASVARLAASLAREGVAAEIGIGFIKGTPTVDEAINALSARHIVVYPMFLSDGYFTRVALPRLVAQAQREDLSRAITVLPPLGLEPALGDLIADEVMATAQAYAIPPAEAAVVLLAHGSRSDQASRLATERLADHMRRGGRFREVRIALLEEAPSLADATADMRGPIVVVGLFAGEGMHGVDDARRLVAELRRNDVVLVGPVGSLAGIESVIASAVIRHHYADR
jgi:sirohydrochlorin cobaltochelatase